MPEYGVEGSGVVVPGLVLRARDHAVVRRSALNILQRGRQGRDFRLARARLDGRMGQRRQGAAQITVLVDPQPAVVVRTADADVAVAEDADALHAAGEEAHGTAGRAKDDAGLERGRRRVEQQVAVRPGHVGLHGNAQRPPRGAGVVVIGLHDSPGRRAGLGNRHVGRLCKDGEGCERHARS